MMISERSLQSAGILQELAQYLNDNIPSVELIAGTIGLASAVIDNVPLVAATMGMYTNEQFPMDSELWQLIAYCAGTGGSILIIGSAAGVAYMGMEKADFIWYLKKVSALPAFRLPYHYRLQLLYSNPLHFQLKVSKLEKVDGS